MAHFLSPVSRLQPSSQLLLHLDFQSSRLMSNALQKRSEGRRTSVGCRSIPAVRNVRTSVCKYMDNTGMFLLDMHGTEGAHRKLPYAIVPQARTNAEKVRTTKQPKKHR